MKMIYLFRSILFSIGQISSLLLFFTIGLLLWPFSSRVRYQFMRGWSVFCVFWLKWTCGVSYEVYGAENIDQTQAGIIFARHESAWETFVLPKFFPRQSFVLKKELLKIPFFGWGLAMLSPIAIDRNAGVRSLKQVLNEGVERLNKGVWVVIFPEGTRMPAGELGKINSGGAMLAIKSKATVYLVAHNSGEYWPKNSFIKTPGKIKVYISKPIDVTNMSVAQLNELTKEWFVRNMN